MKFSFYKKSFSALSEEVLDALQKEVNRIKRKTFRMASHCNDPSMFLAIDSTLILYLANECVEYNILLCMFNELTDIR